MPEFFKQIEQLSDASELELESVIEHLRFDARGLLPVITQDAQTKKVLMLAWMNRAALMTTLETGFVTYWSRSRQQLWVKGETSGHKQALVSMSIDCDGDAILCQAMQTGAACHTLRESCFYLRVDGESNTARIAGKT